jgi:hypothetical protein
LAARIVGRHFSTKSSIARAQERGMEDFVEKLMASPIEGIWRPELVDSVK